MKHSTLLLSLSLFLVACSPAVAPEDQEGGPLADADHIVLTLEQTTTTDDQSIPHTSAKLRMSGAAMELALDLGENIQGPLQYVNPAAYSTYDTEGEVVAVLTAWFAGQGEEILMVSRNGVMTIQHRFGDETGSCTDWEIIAEPTLPAEAAVELAGFGDPIEQSSLAFCN